MKKIHFISIAFIILITCGCEQNNAVEDYYCANDIVDLNYNTQIMTYKLN